LFLGIDDGTVEEALLPISVSMHSGGYWRYIAFVPIVVDDGVMFYGELACYSLFWWRYSACC
jgi:hypothetical protein